MRLLILTSSSKVVRPRRGVESSEVWLRVVDKMGPSGVGRPRTVDVEEQRVDAGKLIGEMCPSIGRLVMVSTAFGIKE